MSGQRQKNRPAQGELAFPAGDRSDAPNAAEGETATLMAKRKTESLAGTERLMEEVCELENCKQALQRVKANKGSPGVDGMTVDELSGLPEAARARNRGTTTKWDLSTATGEAGRNPQAGDGGVRKLGIPTVLDRFVQQAVLQVLREQCARFDDAAFAVGLQCPRAEWCNPVAKGATVGHRRRMIAARVFSYLAALSWLTVW